MWIHFFSVQSVWNFKSLGPHAEKARGADSPSNDGIDSLKYIAVNRIRAVLLKVKNLHNKPLYTSLKTSSKAARCGSESAFSLH